MMVGELHEVHDCRVSLYPVSGGMFSTMVAW